MAYEKQDVVAFGNALGDLIEGVRSDGVGADDFDELVAAVTTAAAAVNEMREVPEAAAEHILGATADRLGDHTLAKATAPPTPTP